MNDQSYFQLITPFVFALFATGFWIVWALYREFRAAFYIGACYAALAVGFTLDFFRHGFDEYVATYLTNVFYLGGPVLFAIGLARLVRQPPPWRRLIAICAVTIPALIWYRQIDDSLIARTLLMNVSIAAVFAVGAWNMNGGIRRWLYRLVQVLVLLYAVVNIPRVVLTVWIEQDVLSTETYTTSITAQSLQLMSGLLAMSTAIVLFVIFGLLIVGKLNREAEEKRGTLQRQFAQFLSPEVVRRLAASDSVAALDVEDRQISLLLIDIRGFTAISEAHGAKEAVKVANHFFAIASEEVFATGGTVDKYMGDAILAFWNAPFDQDDHARLAVECARRVLARLADENHLLVAQGLAPITAVAAVETGQCSVGNMGTAQRIDYTAIGPAVNMVTRLEEQAKLLEEPILIGPGAAKAADMPLTPLAPITVRGLTQPLAVFRPAGPEFAVQAN